MFSAPLDWPIIPFSISKNAKAPVCVFSLSITQFLSAAFTKILKVVSPLQYTPPLNNLKFELVKFFSDNLVAFNVPSGEIDEFDCIVVVNLFQYDWLKSSEYCILCNLCGSNKWLGHPTTLPSIKG